jgi:hypothetical protein
MDSFYHAFKICEKRINSYVNSTEQRNKYITSSDLGGVLLKFNNFFNLALSNLFNINKNINIDEFYNNWLFKQGFISTTIINQSLQDKKQKDEMMKKVREQITVLKQKEEENKIKKLDRDNELYFKDIEDRVKIAEAWVEHIKNKQDEVIKPQKELVKREIEDKMIQQSIEANKKQEEETKKKEQAKIKREETKKKKLQAEAIKKQEEEERAKTKPKPAGKKK